KAHELSPISHAVLGDISPDTLRMIPDLPFSNEKRPGDLFETLESLDHVDAIVLTEIVEHVEDPDALLRLARSKASWRGGSSAIVRGGGSGQSGQQAVV